VGRDGRWTIEHRLRAIGCEIVPPHDADPRIPSVVVFETASDEAVALVRDQRVHAHDRVLVVAHGGHALGRDAVFQLMAAGAADVLAHGTAGPGIDRVAARLERWAAIDELVASDLVARTLVGNSPGWNRLLRQIVEVARFTGAPVLITGETGTGKELVSRLVHQLDARTTKRDFVVLDCTTIVAELSGSEFFGHERGAFTGAASARDGAFALADEGTLFLDEIGELPLALQAELLRVVQEHTYKRVGASVWQNTRFRLVCATNRQLQREQDEGRFRSDLFYRISGWTFQLPALGDRREDIPLLVRHFLREQLGAPPELDDAVLQYLVRREYRGNVRELRQICARIALRHVGAGPITLGDLGGDLIHAPAVDPTGAPAEPACVARAAGPGWCDESFQRSIEKAVAMGVGLKEIGRRAEDVAVRLAVRNENGSLQHAARRLGVTDRALQLRRASSRALALATRDDEHE
jgi:transcriptional regulator with GAF, ATPase, and Fis domain